MSLYVEQLEEVRSEAGCEILSQQRGRQGTVGTEDTSEGIGHVVDSLCTSVAEFFKGRILSRGRS